MTEFRSQTNSVVALPSVSFVENDTTKPREVAKNKQSVELPPAQRSTVDLVRSQQREQQQQSFKQRRMVRQMQYRLLILICLLLGLSVSALVLGVVNWFTLHSLQEQVNQN